MQPTLVRLALAACLALSLARAHPDAALLARAQPDASPHQLHNSPGLQPNQTANRYAVLELLSSVGKAIQQQMLSPAGQLQIVGAPHAEPANTKKNEYQSILANEPPQQQAAQNIGELEPTKSKTLVELVAKNKTHPNYPEQSELLRQDIIRRAGQLQKVVASSMDSLKNNSDVILHRLLDHLNVRLDQAKSKAEKLINEPATNEIAIRSLNTINQGLNNINTIITNLVARLESKEVPPPGMLARRLAGSALLDQIGHHFSTALNATRAQHLQNIQNLQNMQTLPQVHPNQLRTIFAQPNMMIPQTHN